MSKSIKIRSGVKAGGLNMNNHNQIRVRSSIRAGGLNMNNHSQSR